MSSDKTSNQITKEDVQSMKEWFNTHRTGSYHGVRTFEDYVGLIRNALNNKDVHFLKNALRFCERTGGAGFEKIRVNDDLVHLAQVAH